MKKLFKAGSNSALASSKVPVDIEATGFGISSPGHQSWIIFTRGEQEILRVAECEVLSVELVEASAGAKAAAK